MMFWLLKRIRLRSAIRRLPGMALARDSGAKCVQLDSKVLFNDLLRMITILREHDAKISVFDPCYPSPSDPGAYFDYTLQKAVGETWSMTLGNHGWSGGIYRVDDRTLAMQVYGLSSNGRLSKLDVERGTIFEHYAPVTERSNVEMIEKLRTLHAQS
jgi:hypothetical protein